MDFIVDIEFLCDVTNEVFLKKVSFIMSISLVQLLRSMSSTNLKNIWFINGFKNLILKFWHVKVTKNRSQNWPHYNSILLDVYIFMGIKKSYLGRTE